MRKSAYTQEIVESITHNLEPLILSYIEPNDTILVCGASLDLKGLSCFNIVLDILESNDILFDAVPFVIKTDFDEYSKDENLNLMEKFFELEIEEWDCANYLDLVYSFLIDPNISEDSGVAGTSLKKYFAFKYTENRRSKYTKVFFVNGHRNLDAIRSTGVLDNSPLFFKSKVTPTITEYNTPFGIEGIIYEVYPNVFMPTKSIIFNSEALSLIDSATFNYSSKIIPNVGLDITKTKSELRTIVSDWIEKYPLRIEQVLEYEAANKVSYFGLRPNKNKVTLTALIKYLDL